MPGSSAHRARRKGDELTGNLKKLEALDGGLSSAVTPNAGPVRDLVAQKSPKVAEDRRQFTIPSDGWVNGPGRFATTSSGLSLVRG